MCPHHISAGHVALIPGHQLEVMRDVSPDAAKVAASKTKEEQKNAREQEKTDQMNKLADAMQDAVEDSAKENKAAGKAETPIEPSESVGLAGWIGMFSVILLVAAGVYNMPGKKKKVNMNRKRGVFEQFWQKVKGS